VGLRSTVLPEVTAAKAEAAHTSNTRFMVISPT
jgi:hypothetical protein